MVQCRRVAQITVAAAGLGIAFCFTCIADFWTMTSRIAVIDSLSAEMKSLARKIFAWARIYEKRPCVHIKSFLELERK